MFLIQHSFDLMGRYLRGDRARDRPRGGVVRDGRRSRHDGGVHRHRRRRPVCSLGAPDSRDNQLARRAHRLHRGARRLLGASDTALHHGGLLADTAGVPGFDQTRQIGLGYLKSFGAVCIAGLIILILLISFPVILGGIVAVNPETGTPIDAIANGLTLALQYLAMCILLVLSLVKSGAWARDIVSGF